MTDRFDDVLSSMISAAPEHHALLLCVARYPASLVTQNKFVAERIDWDYLGRLLRFHRLEAIASERFAEHGVPVPPGPASVFRNARVSNLICADRLLKGAAEVVSRFNGSGIRYAAFKGVILSAQTDTPLESRSAGDFDLVVDEHRFRDVISILAELNFEPKRWLNAQQFEAAVSRDVLPMWINEYPFARASDEVEIDVHWKVFRNAHCNLDTSDLLQRAQSLDIDGFTFQSVDLDHHAIIVATHAFKHEKFLLKCLFDIESLCACDQVSWSRVVEIAEKTGAMNFLYVALAATGIASQSARQTFASIFKTRNTTLDRVAVEYVRRALQMTDRMNNTDYWITMMKLKRGLRQKSVTLIGLATEADCGPILDRGWGRTGYRLCRLFQPIRWIGRLPGVAMRFRRPQ